MLRLFWCLLLLPCLAFAQSEPSSNASAQPAACGNGVKEADEVCDDGNTISGDGCRADCLGDEVCGDGWVDLGELCDDGNLLSRDGCSDRCSPDLAAPKAVQLATIPRYIESGERLQGLWRSSRVPVDWYEPNDDEKKNPKTARRLARWSTVLGYSVLFVGFAGARLDEPSVKRSSKLLLTRSIGGALAVAGPSAGHIYVGEYQHALRFSTYRALLLSGCFALYTAAYQNKATFLPAIALTGTLWVFSHREARDSKKAAERHNRVLEMQVAEQAQLNR
jgi:cysteine-rich repeat protein